MSCYQFLPVNQMDSRGYRDLLHGLDLNLVKTHQLPQYLFRKKESASFPVSSYPCECFEAGGEEPGSDTAPHPGVVVPLDVLNYQLEQGVASPAVVVRSR